MAEPFSKTADAREDLLEALYDCTVDSARIGRLMTSLLAYWEIAPPLNEAGTANDPDEGLARHFARSLTLLERAPAAAAGRDVRTRYLDALPVAAMILDDRGKVLAYNAAAAEPAQRLLRVQPDGRAWIGAAAADTETFSRAARQLAATPLVPLTITGCDGRPQRLRLLAIDDPEADSAPGGVRAVLALLVTAVVPEQYTELLQAAFALTAAQARLCVTLATGKTLEQIADEFCVSKNTVRTHLAAVFAKTDTHSQAELVARTLETIFAVSSVSVERGATARATPRIKGLLEAGCSSVELGDGRCLAYRAYGALEGKTVFYLHGYADAGLQRPEDAATAARCGVRLICPDRPGIGYSDPRGDPHPDGYANDLVALADHLALDDVHVLGHSAGAWDALAFGAAVDRPVRVALVSGSLPRPMPADVALFERASRAMVRTVWAAPVIGDSVLSLAAALIRQRGVADFIGRAGDAAPEDIAALQLPNLVERIESGVFLAERQGVRHTRLLMQLQQRPQGMTNAGSWRQFGGPLILWHGTEDRVSPFAYLDRLTEHIADREIHVIPGRGHRLYYYCLAQVLGSLLTNAGQT